MKAYAGGVPLKKRMARYEEAMHHGRYSISFAKAAEKNAREKQPTAG